VSELVCICRPKDEVTAELMRQDLAEAGIDSTVANRSSVGLWGDGSLPLASLELLVRQEQAEKAAGILRERYQLND